MIKKKSFLIFMLIVILAILIVLASYYGNLKRKILILRDISQKQQEIFKKDNYYKKTITNTDKSLVITEHYQKGDKSIIFTTITMNSTNETAKEIILSNNEGSKTYHENNKEKIFQENGIIESMSIIPMNIQYANSSDKEIIQAIKDYDISIKNTTYNNKKSYIINYNSIKDFPETYIEKETGLVVKYSNSEYSFEFDNVDESIFTEPNLSQYTLVN